MTVYVTQNRIILFVQPDGPSTTMKPLSFENHGMADKVFPGPGATPNFGRDEFGRPIIKNVTLDAPGGLSTSTIEEDGTGVITYLSKQFERVGCFPVQERYVSCGTLQSGNWDQLWQYGRMRITQKTHGAGPTRDGANANVFDSFEVTWPYTVELVKHKLESLTVSTETAAINDIAMLSDLVPGCNDCFPGYTPDTIMYLAVNATGGSDYADMWYSTDGGGTWAATVSNPFSGASGGLYIGENLTQVEIRFMSDSEFRVIVTNDDTAGQLTYSNFTLGAEGVSSWASPVTIGAAAVEALAWLFYDRVYIAVAGDVYVSTNQGESFGSAVYTGTDDITAFARSYSGDVWAVGTNNTILREKNQSGTFSTRTGPAGGSTFYSVFEANDGRVYAGNGTSIFLSTNKAENTGGWTNLKNFGANKAVVKINCAGGTKSQGGDSQIIRVVVDDLTGGTGAVWESEDGGKTFRQITAVSNTGYNEAAFSAIDDNLAFVVGDAAVLQKLSPAT